MNIADRKCSIIIRNNNTRTFGKILALKEVWIDILDRREDQQEHRRFQQVCEGRNGSLQEIHSIFPLELVAVLLGCRVQGILKEKADMSVVSLAYVYVHEVRMWHMIVT